MTNLEGHVDRLDDAVVRLIGIAENQTKILTDHTKILNDHTQLLRAHQVLLGKLNDNLEKARRIFDMMLRGGAIIDVTKTLNGEGVAISTVPRWRIATVHKILENEA